MIVFTGTRSRNAVIKRMIELGLIADRSEVLQRNRRKAKSKRKNSDDDENDRSSEESDDDVTNGEMRPVKIVDKRNAHSRNNREHKPAQARSTRITLNVAEVRKFLGELSEDMQANVEWICESLSEAAEDAEDGSEDPDDGIPLVPVSSEQRDALNDLAFQMFLKSLGLQSPVQNMVRCFSSDPNVCYDTTQNYSFTF